MTSFSTTCALNGVLSLGFGTFVWWRGRGQKAHALWGLTCLTIAIWSFGLGLEVQPGSNLHAMGWGILSHAAAILIPIVYVGFVCAIFQINARRLLWIGYASAAVLEVLNAGGMLFTVQPKFGFDFYTTARPLYFLFTAYFAFYSLLAHWLLYQQVRRSMGAARTQAVYIFLGTSVAFVGGSSTFLLVFGIPIYPYGLYAVFFYIPMVSYAIVRHRLLDLRIVIRRTLVYSTVTAILTATYVTVLFLITRALEGLVGRPTAYSSAVAASVIAILFHPLQARVQHALDRRFPRESLDQDLLREAASSFVHEIKRPLAKMGMPAQLAIQELEQLQRGERAKENVVPQVIERLRYIVRESMEAGDAIEALRELVGSGTSPSQPVDAVALLSRVKANLQPQAESSGASLELSAPKSTRPMEGHSKQLEIALTNIVKNALEAVSARAAGLAIVSVWAIQQEQDLLIEVQDTGTGITAQDLPKIFAPYFSTKKGRGMGIGLWLAHEIIRNHSGSIQCESTVGKGTTFSIRLPFAPYVERT